MKISTSNANYRINKLITKGYLKREQDPTDKRRYFLNVTEKFMDYYCVNDSLLEQVVKNVRNRVRKEDLEQFESTLAIIIEEMSD
ncbi:MarR family winged helix-turn-helix transcriptional regulator [Enterococcus rivorum]|uniref:MarR family winged helix-turn-helix transcriptional regulator n=1 Tax=Enterococcus rivorum TaxID=762845 RepID=UPI00363FC9BF